MLRPMSSTSKNLDAVAQIISAQSATPSLELKEIFITGISQSSNEIEEGDIFIALPGEKFHGAKFAADAIKKGAKAVLTDKSGAAPVSPPPKITTSFPAALIAGSEGNSPNACLFPQGKYSIAW